MAFTLTSTVAIIAIGIYSAFKKNRYAFTLFLLLGALFLPLKSGFLLDPQRCEVLTSPKYILLSFTNYKHSILFGLLTFIAWANLNEPRRLLKALAILVGFTLILETEQALFNAGHCRLRDLLPNLVGFGLAILGIRFWRHQRGQREN